MNILLFAAAPSNECPKIASFVFARIKELKLAGHSVTVLQQGNIFIGMPRIENFTLRGFRYFLGQVFKFLFMRKNKVLVFEKENVKYDYFNYLYFPSYKKFLKWYKENDFAIIHAHFLWTCKELPKIKEKCKIPFVVSAHGSDIHTNPYKSTEEKKYALRILNNADFVFFVSDFLREKAVGFGFVKSNFAISENGYFENLFYPKENKKVDKNNILLGFIGNPIKIKRFDILPDVLYGVKKKFPNTRLVCVGSAAAEVDLREAAKKRSVELNIRESVEFIDKVPYEQVADYMRKIDILLLPSITEGFSCVALEAQACGTPVICSANGGIPEATGDIGLCVADSDNFINDFVDRIISYIQKPYSMDRIVAASSGRTWENVVKKEIQCYKNVIEKYKYEN